MIKVDFEAPVISAITEVLTDSVWSVLLTQYRAGDKIESIEMGGTCGTYGGRERSAQGFGGETWGKETIGETKT